VKPNKESAGPLPLRLRFPSAAHSCLIAERRLRSLAAMPKAPTPDEFLAALPADRRATMMTMHKAIRKAAPKLAPAVMSGMGASPIIGYGKYRYKSASGREGEWFLIGLAAGKSNYSLHICVGDKDGYLVERNAAKLGKVKTGRSCINFKKLEDLKVDAAMALVKQAEKAGGINAVA
jgi:hypothetical protein